VVLSAIVGVAILCSIPQIAGAGAADNLYTTPGSVTFPDELVGRQSAPQTLMITSTQGVTETANFTISNPAFAQVSGPTAPFSISPGGTATIGLTCTPAQVGANDGTVTITLELDGFITDTLTVPLACAGMPPLSVYAMSQFSFVHVGETKSQYLSLYNIGQPTIAVSSVAITGTDAADFSFSLSMTPPFSLASDTGASGQLTFTPSHEGPATATLEIQSDDPYLPMRSIPLSGYGFDEHVSVSPSVLDFSVVAVGGTSSRPLTVTNLDTTALELSFVLAGDDVTPFTLDTTMLSIPGGESRVVNVTYSPDAFRTSLASLAISPTTPPLAIDVVGIGTSADLELSPKPLAFASTAIGEQSEVQTVTLTNHAAQAVVVRQIEATDRAFLVEAPVPAELAPGQSLMFDVAFAPPAPGAYRASVRVYVGDQNSRAAVVAVSGEAAHASDAPHAGGCSVSGSSSSLLILSAGLLVMRRSRRRS